jgi:hypothetical protein
MALPTTQYQGVQVEADTILENLERWKKRVIAAFLLLSLLVAVAAVLLFELGGVIKVWKIEFWDAAPATAVTPQRTTGGRPLLGDAIPFIV